MSKCLSKMNKKELYELSKKLVEENKTLQLFINGDEEKVEFLENKILDLENKIVEQDVEICNLKLELKYDGGYEQLFNEVKAERDDLQDDLCDLSSELEEKQCEIVDLEKSVEELREEVSNFATEIEGRSAQIRHFEKIVEELEDTLKLKEEEVSMLIYEKKQENNKVCNLVSKIHQTLSPEDCKKLQEENRKLKEQLEEKNTIKFSVCPEGYAELMKQKERLVEYYESDDSDSSDEE